jgi:hypothetical protein
MIHVEMTKREYIEANRLILTHYFKRNVVWLLAYCAVCIAVFPFILEVDLMLAAAIAFTLLILGFAAICAYVRFVLPWRFGRVFDKTPLLGAPFSVEYSEEGLRFRSEYGESKLPWAHWAKWQESRSLILVSAAHNLFHVLPKRCFSNAESIAQFRSTLVERIGSAC